MAVQDHAIVRVWRRQAGKSEEYLGSAFLLSARHLLTCLHVVGNLDTREPIPAGECFLAGLRPGGVWVTVGQIKVSPNRDIALLMLQEAAPDVDFMPIPLSSVGLSLGFDVEVKGFASEDGGLESCPMTISSYAESQATYIAHTDIGKGISGGAVLFNGKLVGIVQAKNAEKNQTHIIPLAEFDEFLRQQMGAYFSCQNQPKHPQNRKPEQSKSQVPPVLAALLGKRPQLKHIKPEQQLDHSPRAYVLDGIHQEWPEALRDRLAFKLSPLDFLEQKTLEFKCGSKSAEDALLGLLAQPLHIPKDKLNLDMLKDRLQTKPFPLVLRIDIFPDQEPDTKTLKQIIELWEGLELPTVQFRHYLLFIRVQYKIKEKGILIRLRKVFRREWAVQLGIALKKSKLTDRLLPPLQSPDANDVLVIWPKEVLGSEHVACLQPGWDMTQTIINALVDSAEALFDGQVSAIPHRQLKTKLEQILQNLPSET